MNGEGGSLLGEGVSRRILPNVASNLAFMLVNFVMGLVLVPYYISELGVAAYAIIPVATSITSYITLISDSLTSTVSRYLTIDMGSDMTSAKRTFNTAVFGFTCIVVAAIPIIILISLLAPSIFDIATNTVLSVQVMFVCILSAVLIRLFPPVIHKIPGRAAIGADHGVAHGADKHGHKHKCKLVQNDGKLHGREQPEKPKQNERRKREKNKPVSGRKKSFEH